VVEGELLVPAEVGEALVAAEVTIPLFPEHSRLKD